MLTALDHLIIGVNDLAQATTVFSEKIGLAPSGGGTHPSGGTANRIIVIGDTYLELITIQTPAEAQQSMRERLAKGDGYLNFALSSNDIEADTREMVQRGVSVIGPKSGQLKAANGQVRGWSRTD
ncbi:MAG: VOC family protein, partial [Chloroflexi bacterium]